MREPWEKLEAESPRAFAAFAVYRDRGTDRSIRETAKQLHKSERLLFSWSTRHAWISRTHDFDVHNDRLRSKQLEKAREAATERHTRVLMLIQAKAVEALQMVEGDMLTTTDIVRWLEVGMKLERIVRGADSPEEAAKLAYLVLWERLGGPELELDAG